MDQGAFLSIISIEQVTYYSAFSVSRTTTKVTYDTKFGNWKGRNTRKQRPTRRNWNVIISLP